MSRITDVLVVKDRFLNGLNGALKQKVLNINPTNLDTFDKLYATTQRLDEDWRAHSGPSNSGGSFNPGRKKMFFKRVRQLNDQEKATMMKEGKCFGCRKVGHLAKDCPDKGQKGSSVNQIRTILNGLDNVEKKETLEALENQGF
ncbi:hypothetical protein QCA50_007994 [Cerrena zonata]|uniref:CCHC-type domain-containing protein n=1 Tax=Cerrena zonata TaxID=2478898 RepID=A0AAW0GG38_9APHY